LSGRRYDPLLGYGGAAGAVYPALADAEAQQQALANLSMTAPGRSPRPVLQEAAEIVWLLGAPFFVQVIQGTGEEVAHVVAGPAECLAEGQRLLDARWRVTMDRPADVVIAQVAGDPARHTFSDLARALAAASRAVRPQGKIVLLSGGRPELGPGAHLLRQEDTPEEALHLLRQKLPADYPAAFQWASAARRAHLYLFTPLPPPQPYPPRSPARRGGRGDVRHATGPPRPGAAPGRHRALPVPGGRRPDPRRGGVTVRQRGVRRFREMSKLCNGRKRLFDGR